MRLRRLQYKNDKAQWRDEAYAIEKEDGQVVLRYSVLTWGRVGATYNSRLKESKVTLENVDTVVEPDNDVLKWQPIEIVEDSEAEAYVEALNEACYIPDPRKLKKAKTVVA